MGRVISQNICLILGILLLFSSGVIWKQNQTATRIRHDGSAVSYNLRSDLFVASFVSGAGLVIVGVRRYASDRRLNGKVARAEESVLDVAILGGAIMFGARGLLALAYAPLIYAHGVQNQPFSSRGYWGLSLGLMCAAGLLVTLVYWWRERRLRCLVSEFGPICKGCGYSLRGINSLVCPECGQEFDPTHLLCSVGPNESMNRLAKLLKNVLSRPRARLLIGAVILLSALFLLQRLGWIAPNLAY